MTAAHAATVTIVTQRTQFGFQFQIGKDMSGDKSLIKSIDMLEQVNKAIQSQSDIGG